MQNLSPRLKTAAGMVRHGKKTVDIGTDHAYLPAYLVMNGISEAVIAADIGRKPLLNAAKTVEEYSLSDKITLRISDGLQNIKSEEAEEITLCGMGGTLISDILSSAPWIKKQDMHLVLQPMTHTEDVRRFLCENGFVILKERCVEDSGHLYCVLSAFYTGRDERRDEGYYYFGALCVGDDVSLRFYGNQYRRVMKKYNALTKAGFDNSETRMLYQVKSYYERKLLCENK